MTERTVYCLYFKKDLPGLRRPPFNNELGQKIFEHISQAAWQEWLKRQTMFINEYRLNISDFQAKQFLQDQLQTFLFNQEDVKPNGYTPEEK